MFLYGSIHLKQMLVNRLLSYEDFSMKKIIILFKAIIQSEDDKRHL